MRPETARKSIFLHFLCLHPISLFRDIFSSDCLQRTERQRLTLDQLARCFCLSVLHSLIIRWADRIVSVWLGSFYFALNSPCTAPWCCFCLVLLLFAGWCCWGAGKSRALLFPVLHGEKGSSCLANSPQPGRRCQKEFKVGR